MNHITNIKLSAILLYDLLRKADEINQGTRNISSYLRPCRQFDGVSAQRHFEIDERLVHQVRHVGHPGQRRERTPRQRPLDDAAAAPGAGNGDPREEKGPAHFGEADAGEVSSRSLPSMDRGISPIKTAWSRFDLTSLQADMTLSQLNPQS